MLHHSPIASFLILTSFLAMGAEPEAADPFASHVRPTPHLSPEDEMAALQVPEGFKITLFASEPDIAKPLNMAFDDKARLWLTNTVEYPYPAAENVPGRDSVKILTDTDGDGAADTITTFADGLNIPIGITPYGDGAICFSIPNILYLRDTDGDGVCDKREKLYGPFDYSRDTHGMVNSFLPQPDGWIYACHGFNNISKVAGTDGHEVEMQSGNVFRFRPDGSRIEVYTRGQVNPFGLVANSRGDLFSADCHTKPISLLVQGGYHESFGKPHDGLGFIPNMMEHLHGSTAICGLALGEKTHFPAAYRDSVFSGNVTTCRINRNRIEYRGTSPFAIEEPDFLISKDPWFRPVDLKTSPDGALFVADFYNAVIGHYEVPLDHPKRDRTSGRIWRISYDGGQMSPAKTAPVSNKRQAALATNSEEQIRPLLDTLINCPAEDVQLRYAVRLALRNHLLNDAWFSALTNSNLTANEIREIADICPAVRTPASARFLLHHIEATENMPLDQLRQWLEFAAQNAGADSLENMSVLVQKRFPDLEFQKELLFSLQKGLASRGEALPSAILEWAESLARKLLQPTAIDHPGSWTLDSPAWSISTTRTSADGMENTMLWSSFPNGETGTGIFRTAPFVVPDEFFFYLAGHDGFPEKSLQNKNLVVLRDASTNEILFSASPPRNDVAQKIIWNTSAHSGKEVVMELIDGDDASAYAWLAAGRFSVDSLNPSTLTNDRRIAAEIIQHLHLRALRSEAEKSLRKEDKHSPAAKALSQAIAAVSDDPLHLAVAEVFNIPGAPDDILNLAAGSFNTTDSTKAFFPWVMRALPSDGQQRIANKLIASPAGIDVLLDLIEAGTAAGSELRRPVIAQNMSSIGSADQKSRAKAILDKLPPDSVGLPELIAERIRHAQQNPGNSENGKQLFAQQCMICHQVAGQGGQLAPNLDGIGHRGLERLAEDILDPNRNVDILFRMVTVIKKDGSAVTGFIRNEEPNQLILADPTGLEIILPKPEIAKTEHSVLSLMPPAFGQILTDTQFSDLAAWLLTLR